MPTDVETDFVLYVDRNRRVDERRREEWRRGAVITGDLLRTNKG